jgi:hypothetical protein
MAHSASSFRFDRRWAHAVGEPHVVIVEGRAQLAADYDVAGADVIDTAYAGGGWDAFAARACAALKLPQRSMQVFTEAVFDRADEKPIVIYVGNAGALARDCGVELVSYLAFFEGFAQFVEGPAQPMFLALQMPADAEGRAATACQR